MSFCVERGSFVGLIGPNGAGKSTMVKMLLGLIKNDRGSYRFAHSTIVRYVPQQYDLQSYVPVSVLEVVQMGSYTRVSKDDVIRVLSHVGLNETFFKRNYHSLSGGQKQRVMIARALIVAPDIIFFDEPLSGVDLETKLQIHTFLKDLNNSGTTIFFVSHDIDHVVDACDLVLCLDKSLHQGCHPIAFAQGKRHIAQRESTVESTCLVRENGAVQKQHIHHHH